MKSIIIAIIIIFSLPVYGQSGINKILKVFSETSYILNYVNDKEKYDWVYSENPLKDYEQFKEDSLKYFAAYDKFINSESSVIDTLLKYLDDTTECKWVLTFWTFSSIHYTVDQIVNRKDISALILIENYLKPTF